MGAAIVAVALILLGAAYIHLRWRRSPRAYSAMIVLSIGYFIAGVLGTLSMLHPATPKPSEAGAREPSAGTAVASSVDPYPNRYSGKVVSVTDGDTIDVALDPNGQVQAIRLEGIDAPESAQTFGSQSTQQLAKLVSGKTVKLECENDRSYGRFICKVLLLDGEDVDLDLVKGGLAWHYKQYEDEQSAADRVSYAAAECTAMKSKIGLWSQPEPEQPQDFRHATHSQMLFGPDGCRISSEPTSGPVRGNARSHIFHWSGCPYYDAISPDNRVPFPSPQAAERAGYRPAHDCP